jgi:hypothetical protein
LDGTDDAVWLESAGAPDDGATVLSGTAGEEDADTPRAEVPAWVPAVIADVMTDSKPT